MGAERQGGSHRRLGDFWAYTPFGKVAKIAVIAAAIGVVAFDTVAALSGASQEEPTRAVAQILLTASFALFAWRPPTAALVLFMGVTTAVSFGIGDEPLVMAAFAGGLVAASCSILFSATYVAAYIGVLALAAVGDPEIRQLPAVVTFLFTLGLAVGIGLIFRRISQRAAHLSVELVERQRQLEEAVRVERERLADELHDFIAHELTIIAMHARVLEQTDDPEIQAESREAISSSARQALADIRRVLEITQASRLDGELDDPVVERRRLGPTVADIERELGSTGARVTTEGVYEAAERMSRTMEVALAQFVREAATNVVKHAPGTPWVSFRFTVEGEFVTARVENASVGTTESLALPTGGYGLARMRERAKVFGGSFEAGPTDEGWAVEVRLPVQ